MAQVTGIVKIFLNGQMQRSHEGAKLSLGGVERTAVMSHSLDGYSEKPVPATLTFELSHMADTDLNELADMVDATARFECDTGVTYLVANAFVTKPPELTGGEGKVAVEMQGDPAVQE